MKKGLISTIVGAAGSALVAGIAVNNMKTKEVENQSVRADKNAMVIDILARWVSIMQDGKSLTEYFERYQYKTIAVYGMHYVGERLCRELAGTGIEVKYAIDQVRTVAAVDVAIRKPGDYLDEVDAVIVTPVYYFQQISENLSGILACPIISFEEILDEVEAGFEN